MYAVDKLALKYIISGSGNKSSFLKPGFPGGYQSLIFNLFGREALFHEDFFHAGQMVALKFYGISLYRPAACEF